MNYDISEDIKWDIVVKRVTFMGKPIHWELSASGDSNMGIEVTSPTFYGVMDALSEYMHDVQLGLNWDANENQN